MSGRRPQPSPAPFFPLSGFLYLNPATRELATARPRRTSGMSGAASPSAARRLFAKHSSALGYFPSRYSGLDSIVLFDRVNVTQISTHPLISDHRLEPFLTKNGVKLA